MGTRTISYLSCPNCGEEYEQYDTMTLKEVEKILIRLTEDAWDNKTDEIVEKKKLMKKFLCFKRPRVSSFNLWDIFNHYIRHLIAEYECNNGKMPKKIIMPKQLYIKCFKSLYGFDCKIGKTNKISIYGIDIELSNKKEIIIK